MDPLLQARRIHASELIFVHVRFEMHQYTLRVITIFMSHLYFLFRVRVMCAVGKKCNPWAYRSS